MGCDGFCAAAAFPWWLVAAQLCAIIVLAWLAKRGWVHHAPARIAGMLLTALLAGYVYVGRF